MNLHFEAANDMMTEAKKQLHWARTAAKTEDERKGVQSVINKLTNAMIAHEAERNKPNA